MDNKQIEEMATKLIEVKRQIRALEEEEKRLKTEIKPYFQENREAMNFESGRVYCTESNASRSLKRRETLDYIRKNFGNDIADQIDENCTSLGKPRQTVSVKLFL
ncbi:hypothetical protein [Candidatus Albibeggiatoa sp. nov. BB20]|uniref:hypothetical protein n=1 Tax=Candidatus Albibeggiatoa sp. nov. BB20 TaxID=3162723 RepID=UPI0033655269